MAEWAPAPECFSELWLQFGKGIIPSGCTGGGRSDLTVKCSSLWRSLFFYIPFVYNLFPCCCLTDSSSCSCTEILLLFCKCVPSRHLQKKEECVADRLQSALGPSRWCYPPAIQMPPLSQFPQWFQRSLRDASLKWLLKMPRVRGSWCLPLITAPPRRTLVSLPWCPPVGWGGERVQKAWRSVGNVGILNLISVGSHHSDAYLKAKRWNIFTRPYSQCRMRGCRGAGGVVVKWSLLG